MEEEVFVVLAVLRCLSIFKHARHIAFYRVVEASLTAVAFAHEQGSTHALSGWVIAKHVLARPKFRLVACMVGATLNADNGASVEIRKIGALPLPMDAAVPHHSENVVSEDLHVIRVCVAVLVSSAVKRMIALIHT